MLKLKYLITECKVVNIIGFFNFFKNRYNVLYIIVILIIITLSFRLATLTIVEGEKYKEIANVKTIKDIPIKAPRGKIYDRNGIVLADNLTSFTVQLYKNKINTNNFNDTIYTLSKILDENGENLIDEFPILLNTFEYKSLENENTQIPTEYVANILKSNGLVNDWMNTQMNIDGQNYSVKDRVVLLLCKKITDFPVKLTDGIPSYIDDETKCKEWLRTNDIDENITVDGLLEYYLNNENKYLVTLLSNSRIRKFTFDYLNEKGLVNDINMVDYVFSYDQQYKSIKNALMSSYEGITEVSTAKDDFIYLIKYEVFDKLFSTIYQDGDEKVIPADILLKKLKEKYTDFPVDVIENEDGILSFIYIKDGIKDTYINSLKLEETTSAYQLMKTLALADVKIVNEVITSDEVCSYAQQELLNRGINPYISIATWEYTYLKEKNAWIENNVGKKTNLSVEEIFKTLKEKFEFDFEISDYDARNMLVIEERYSKQGYLSYHPIDICYDVSDKTVAMISERNYELDGVNIEIDPIRYYPNSSLAAHVIGYLGKISQESEIEEYVVNQNYSLDDIIGKTGVEEKFEKYLSGTKGKKTVAVNSMGSTIESVSEQAPIPGDDLYLTIDSRLQQKTEESLKKGLEALQEGGTYESEWGNYKYKDPYKNATSGSLVALDCKTGEVLAMANYPSYDPNMFSTGISSEDWNSLMNDSLDPLAPRPLYNIALLTAIQPGSTFKMVTALAALEKGVDPNTKIYCAGVMQVGQRNFGCWIYNLHGGAHGYQTMYDAIKNSCNYYFFTTMLGENPVSGQGHTVKLSFEDVTAMATMLGLNDETGIEIDIPKEYSGGVPNVETKKSSMRVYLRLYLEQNLQYYVKDDYEMDQEEMEKAINTIVSWVNADETLTRGEVYRGLEELNIDPEKTNKSNVPIVDTIKYTYLNHSVWNSGDSLNISIGQGSNAYTPVQMANYVATIANGGYKHNVSVVKKCVTFDGTELTNLVSRESERIQLRDYSYLDVVKKGMNLVAHDSSAFANFPVEVGVKTGTAQKDGINPETGEAYDDFAWYVAFAPYDDPQIAIACVIFQGGSGLYPAPIVRDVIAEYLVLNGTLERPNKE